MENKAVRLQEIKEVAELAFQHGDFDMLEQLFMEMKELDEEPSQTLGIDEGKLYSLSNSYIDSTPVSQIVSDRLTQLIEFYGKKMIFGKKSKMNPMLIVHLDNLQLTYGKETLKTVGSWFQ